MTKRMRRTHSTGFKAKVALAAIKGEKCVSVSKWNSMPNAIEFIDMVGDYGR